MKEELYTKKIGQFRMLISFGDNDFVQTFRAMIVAIRETLIGEWTRLSENPFLAEDKERATKVINENILGFYRLSQNPFVYDHGQGYEHDSQIVKNGVSVSSKYVMFGSEVDSFLLENEWANGEVIVLDMRLPEDQQIFTR